MALAITWDETAPASGDDPRDGDNEIRDLKVALRERLRQGGLVWEVTGPSKDNEAGKIACGVQAANVWRVYETDKTTIVLDINDSTKKVVVGDGLTGVRPYTLEIDKVQADEVVVDTDFTLPTGRLGAYANAAENIPASGTSIAASGSSGSAITATLNLGDTNSVVLIFGEIEIDHTTADDFILRVDVDRDDDGTYEVADLLQRGGLTTFGLSNAGATRSTFTISGVDTGNVTTGNKRYRMRVDNASTSATISYYTYNLTIIELRLQ